MSKFKVGDQVRNIRYSGRGEAHATQRLVSFDEATDTAEVERFTTNGMTARVKLSNLELVMRDD